jgi:hypothetical protein
MTSWKGRDPMRRFKLAFDPSSIMNPGMRRRGFDRLEIHNREEHDD